MGGLGGERGAEMIQVLRNTIIRCFVASANHFCEQVSMLCILESILCILRLSCEFLVFAAISDAMENTHSSSLGQVVRSAKPYQTPCSILLMLEFVSILWGGVFNLI